MSYDAELNSAAIEAAWTQFARMQSSNPGDIARHVVSGIEPLIAERVRLAQEQAWNEGWARAMVRIEVDGEVQPESNPYTQGDKQA